MNLLTQYHNGNYHVFIGEDGTKIRYNNLHNLIPSFAESIDCSITEKCDGGCQYCYLGCTENGKHADLNQPFFNTFHKGQELALNGNDLSHPDLVPFLERMRQQGIICNLTVNQKHFIKHIGFIKDLCDKELVYGIGVSLTDSKDKRLYEFLNQIPNSVLHTIDGLLTEDDINNLSRKDIKLLILGYKILGRGDEYYYKHKEEIEHNIQWLSDNISTIYNDFNVVSFDNLALEHLDLKSKVDVSIWDRLYMGDEGSYTFYIDAVNKKFAMSSLEKTKFDIMDNVDDMFNFIRSYYEIQYE